MINREATIRWKGYDPDDLELKSGKRVWVNCNTCGDGRWVTMRHCYNNDLNLCRSCTKTNPSKETRQRISAAQTKKVPKYDKIDIEHNLILPRQYKKRLFGLATKGVGIEISCDLNSKTKNIIINTKFYKISDGGMENNKSCASYLGVHIAERILSKIFKNVQRMQYGNPGYDFTCGRDYKIDVKTACARKRYSGTWGFHINKNQTTDYFLCLAFDNRKDLNPQHIWLIPGYILNTNMSANISKSTLDKWSKYELNKLDDIISCCDILRSE